MALKCIDDYESSSDEPKGSPQKGGGSLITPAKFCALVEGFSMDQATQILIDSQKLTGEFLRQDLSLSDAI